MGMADLRDTAGWCLSLTRYNAGPLLQCPCTSVPAAKRTDEWTPGTVRPLIAHALNGDNSADCTALHPWCPCSCLSVAMYIRSFPRTCGTQRMTASPPPFNFKVFLLVLDLCKCHCVTHLRSPSESYGMNNLMPWPGAQVTIS